MLPLRSVAASCLLTAVLLSFLSAQAAHAQPSHLIRVSLKVPDTAWKLKIEEVYTGDRALIVLAELRRPPGQLGALAITTTSDSVRLPVTPQPIRVFVLGKTWNWRNEEPYKFLAKRSEFDQVLKGQDKYVAIYNRKLQFAAARPRRHEVRVQIVGELHTGVNAIGGETTGTVIRAGNIEWELELRGDLVLKAAAEKLNGQTVEVKGTLQKKRGVEVHTRWIVQVTALQGATRTPEPAELRDAATGVTVKRIRGRVQITKVRPNSPATKIRIAGELNKLFRLEAGDRFAEVNGRPVNTAAEFLAAVKASPQEMRAVIIARQDDKRYNIRITLNR